MIQTESGIQKRRFDTAIGMHAQIATGFTFPILQHIACERAAVDCMCVHRRAVGVAVNQHLDILADVFAQQRLHTGFGGIGNFAFALGIFLVSLIMRICPASMRRSAKGFINTAACHIGLRDWARNS